MTDGEVVRVTPDHDAQTCPTCGQFVKVYHRSIFSTMAKDLIKIYRSGRDWVHVPTLIGKRDGTAAKLRFWGLIESRGDEREDGNPWSGMWRITDFGVEFVHGRAKVIKYVDTYNRHIFGTNGPMVDIHDCLKNKFNYDELMSGNG